MMSELSYKELQEQGVFDAPYRAFELMQEQQNKIDAHNKKLSIFIDELKKTHGDDKDIKWVYWWGFLDWAEASVKVFYRDVGFAGED